MILVLIVSLYTSRIVLRTLGFEDYGIYNVVGSVVVFLSFLEQALTNATYRFIAFEIGKGSDGRVNEVYSMAINSHMILAAILFVIMEAVGVWFINTHLNITPDRLGAANRVYQFSLITFIFSVCKTPFNSNIIAHERMDFYAIISILEVSLKLAIAFLLIVSPIDKLVSYGALQMVVALLVFCGYFLFSKFRIKDTKYIRIWNKKLIFEFVGYSGWSMYVNGAAVTTQQCLSVFFNWFVGLAGNAALGIANQVSGSLNMFVSSFTQAYNPQIIKSYASKEYDYFNKLIFSASKISYLLLLFIAVPAVANIEFILKIWLGDYPNQVPSYIRAVILCYFVDAIQYPLMTAVHATGKIKVHQIIVGTIKLLAIPLIYIALKYSGDGTIALLILSGQNLVCAVARVLYVNNLFVFNVWKYVKEVVIKAIELTLLVVPLPFLLVRLIGINIFGFLSSCLASVIICFFVGVCLFLNQHEREVCYNIPIVGRFIKVINADRQ